MMIVRRRLVVAAGGTLAAATFPRKPHAAPVLLTDATPALPAVRPTEPSGEPLPPFIIRLPDGTERTIADYAGRGVVLNLWATWCVPCVAEMPALDALAAAVAGSGVVVLPLSSDRGGVQAVQAFYQAHGITHLPVLLDPAGAASRALGARGIPTTLLIDKSGKEHARMEGAAAWDSPASITMVKRLAL